MEAMRQQDIAWRQGRSPLYMFYADDEVYQISQQAYLKFFSENALGSKRAFFSLRQMEDDIIGMALELFHAPAEACGNLTLGGSESIFMAVKTCRDWMRANKQNLRQPNIVAPYSVHPAFNKAGVCMDIEIRRVALKEDFRTDVAAMRDAIDNNTIMLVGSAPCFPHGVIDPIAELSDLALQAKLWLHVDACVGGYLAPFVKQLGHPLPDFDFALPGVSSLSADLHKFGFCPKPASTVFYRSPELYAHQAFDLEDWPSGRFVTQTLSGTRPGGAVAAAWAVLNHLGQEGYRRIAKRLLATVQAYRQGIEAIDGLFVYGQPDLSIITFGAQDLDIYQIAEQMQALGWLPGLLRQPRGMHLMLSLLHETCVDDYLEHLDKSTQAVKNSGQSGSALNAVY